MQVSRIEGHYQLHSHIEKTLQPELLKGILDLLWPQDMTRSCRVSRYWRDLTVEAAMLREARVVLAFGKFLGCEVTECMNFLLAENLVDIKKIQAKYRLELVKEMAQKEEDLNKLECSSAMIRKPLFFDNLFDLAKLQGKIDKESIEFSSDDCGDYACYLCQLGSFENSIAMVSKASEDEHEALFYDAAVELCSAGKPKRALEIANGIKNVDLQHMILIELFACGAFTEAKDLGLSLQFCNEFIEVLQLIFTGPFNKELKERIFTWQDTDLAEKALERSCNQLIHYEKFDEFRLLLPLLNKINRDDLNQLFSIKLIELGRFEEAEKIYSSLLRINVPYYSIYCALNSKGKFEKSREMAENITGADAKELAEQDIQFHEYLVAKKYDEAMAICRDNFVMTKALADSGQLDKAVAFALTISDCAIKAKAWRYLNNFFDI